MLQVHRVDIHVGEQSVVCPAHGVGVTDVVQHEGTVVEQLEHLLACCRIDVARAVGALGEGIEIDAVIHIAVAAELPHVFECVVRLAHVHAIVAVVGNHNHCVFPRAEILAGNVTVQLIHHFLSLGDAFHRHTSHADAMHAEARIGEI